MAHNCRTRCAVFTVTSNDKGKLVADAQAELDDITE